jgi:hypothetical protein
MLSTQTLRTAQDELAALGFPVDPGEAGRRPQLGPSTKARLQEFQKKFNLPETGKLDIRTGRLMTLAVAGTHNSNSATLLAAVGADGEGPTGDAVYDAMRARYAASAGDTALAAAISGTSLSAPANLARPAVGPGGPPIVNPAPPVADPHPPGGPTGPHLPPTGPGSPILDPDPSRMMEPETPFPGNYYSYRHPLLNDAELQRRLVALDSLSEMAREAVNVDGATSPVVRDPPPEPFPQLAADAERHQVTAGIWLRAIAAWQFGNSEMDGERYQSAADAYTRSQVAALNYFHHNLRYQVDYVAGASIEARIDELIRKTLWDTSFQRWPTFYRVLNGRRGIKSLEQLKTYDWSPADGGANMLRLLDALLVGAAGPPGFSAVAAEDVRQGILDARLFLICTLFAPMARAEANRMQRRGDAALHDLDRVLRDAVTFNGTTVPFQLRCEFIETPFARLLGAEVLFEKAEGQFKARTLVDDEPDAGARANAAAAIAALAQEFSAAQIPSGPTSPFQDLLGAATLAGLIERLAAEGSAVAHVRTARDTAQAAIASSTSPPTEALLTLPAESGIKHAPGPSATHPHAALVAFDAVAQATANPRVYALLLQSQARLLQMWSGFNYLGYRDDYVPPWRFQYLLERARYFSEHAKNAQRDYLNFLSNAENEAFKEMSAAQGVELEKANVRIEDARVTQASLECEAASQSLEMATIVADNAQERLDNYRSFDDTTDLWSIIGKVEGLGTSAALAAATGGASGGGSLLGALSSFMVEDAQRDLEESNLRLAKEEADQAKIVAEKQRAVASQAWVVADLQRQAAFLRHAQAIVTLQFLRARTLNTEQWFRLSSAIRGVAETYLRYAIETAFLAEQAYEFEADKRLDIIRFDYDQSDVGAMLAADFLLRDLDSLEQDLIVTQRVRQQQVRYVLSMAREFPDTLQTLAETGEAVFTLTLQQIERRLPGLHNLRITGVELLPVALMDPTRVSVELTHLGAGQVRLKAQPGPSPLNLPDIPADQDWLDASAGAFPIKVRVTGPESAVFAGLSRQESASISLIAANQRGAFEGLAAGSSWRLDMSMRENQVVPGSLADMLITFTLSGYHDPDLRAATDAAIDNARPAGITRALSVRSLLPDSYYSLVQYGRADWPVNARMLTIAGAPEALRNVAVLLPLALDGPELGRCYCRYDLEILVASSSVEVLSLPPAMTIETDRLNVRCALGGDPAVTASWDFGDDTPMVSGTTVQHAYARPGRYELRALLTKGQRLSEYRAAIVVSEVHQVTPPLIVAPTLSAGSVDAVGMVPISASVASSDVSIECAIGRARVWAGSAPVALNAPPGRHVLSFLAVRTLNARFYSRQRYLPAAALRLDRGRIATNRRFSQGVEVASTPNTFTTHVFAQPPGVLSPNDRWTLEIPIDENPWFRSIAASDIAEFDAGELSDAILTLEFEGR